ILRSQTTAPPRPPLFPYTTLFRSVCSAVLATGQGIGFAIPIDRALRVARELVKSGGLADTWWGFDAEAIEKHAGALITSVDESSPAASAGLKRGDTVLRVDGTPVHDADELRFLLRDVPVGTRVTIGVVRGKENTDLPIAAAPLTPERAQAVFESRSGIAVAEMSARE